MKKFLIVANWKMNPKSLKEAVSVAHGIAGKARGKKKVDVVITPPAPFLSGLCKMSGVAWGAQDVSVERGVGARTGEVSGTILRSLGIKYVIIGHSERRARGETNEMVAAKVASALREGIRPILCIGELHRDEEGKYFHELHAQVHASLKDVGRAQLKNIIIAYEPVWAVGRNAERADTPEDTLEAVLYLRKTIAEMSGAKSADNIILYGGSVSKDNSREFLIGGGVNGLLVGRASLKAVSFGAILRDANTISV